MRTAGLTMNDVWADRVLRERGVETTRHERLLAEIGVLVESVDLMYGERDRNYRPYLHLTGELRSITPLDEALPYEISEITYTPGHGEKVDAFYAFDDAQLAVLAGKGYFSPAFVVPEKIIGIEWKLPASVDVLVLAPSDPGSDLPVVFTHVHDIGSLDIDLEASGYDLADYFADHSKKGVSRDQVAVDARGLRARSDAINSLFSDDEVGDLLPVDESPVEESRREIVADGVSTRLQQAEAEIAADQEVFRSEQLRIEGAPENLYAEHVAQVLRETEAEEPGRRFVERKHQVVRSAADLDLGDDDEHGLGS